MTQADEYLLLKDLCTRLPYGVILDCCEIINEPLTLISCKGLVNNDYDIDEVKPYLFPLSSITEEQKEEYVSLQQRVIYNSRGLVNLDVMKYTDWCYKHHIDINGLIPMGLAIDATDKNIY